MKLVPGAATLVLGPLVLVWHLRWGMLYHVTNRDLMNALSWILRLVAAVILGQTLFFKFTGAEESKYIFETLGMEPWGRIGSGVAELVAVVLLLVPATRVYGALLTTALMIGAIGSHLTKLGIEVRGDGGLLFGLGITAFLAAAALLWIHRSELPFVGR